LKRWKTSNSARASSAAVGSSRIRTCGIAHVGAGDGDLLPLAARQVDAVPEALADHLVVAAGQASRSPRRRGSRWPRLDARAVVARLDAADRDVVGGGQV
jgi:hypothetical protein